LIVIIGSARTAKGVAVALNPAQTRYLYVVRSVFSSPEHEAAWNDWYDTVHLPELLSVPGFVSAVRFRQLGAEGHYLAWNESEHPRVFSEPRYAEITGWGEWAPMIAEWSRSIHVIEGELPIVNYLPRGDGRASDLASDSRHRQET
jgi:hypothetical protein